MLIIIAVVFVIFFAIPRFERRRGKEEGVSEDAGEYGPPVECVVTNRATGSPLAAIEEIMACMSQSILSNLRGVRDG